MKQILFILLLTLSLSPKAQTINTIAGNGIDGFYGDGGNALLASLNPRCLTYDKKGNLYFSDGSCTIRKIDINGIINTIVGTTINGYNGDNIPAIQANITVISGIAFDKNGNLFFSDAISNRIRKVDTSGIITTFVGNGLAGFIGDGGKAKLASINQPRGLVFDKIGNLIFSDCYNNRIRKVDTTGIITTIAGTGISGFSGDSGLAKNAEISFPYGISIDTNDVIFFIDRNNSRVRKIDTDNIIYTVAGTGSNGAGNSYSGDNGDATLASLNTPTDVTIGNNGYIYIADNNNYRIRVVNEDGIISTKVGTGTDGFSGDGGLSINANIGLVSGLTIDNYGNLVFSDHTNYRIRKVQQYDILSTSFFDFQLARKNNQMNISWSTEDELNTKFYLVKKSKDGIHFETISTVNPKFQKNNTYTIIDYNDLTKNLYYQVEVVYQDGSKTISPIKSLTLKEKNRFSIYPNPASNQVFLNQYDSKVSFDIKIFDLKGIVMYEKNNINEGFLAINTHKFQTGIYTIRIKSENELRTEKLIIAK